MVEHFNERRKWPHIFDVRLLRIQKVEQMCSLSKRSIYNAIKLGTFPFPIKTGRAPAPKSSRKSKVGCSKGALAITARRATRHQRSGLN